MRCLALCALLLVAPFTLGQSPEEPLPAILPPQVVIDENPPVGCGHYFGADVFLGLPTGIRIQAGILHRPAFTLAVDGLFGALVTRGDIPGVAGGGPRLLWNLFCHQSNAFQINPGVYFLGKTASTDDDAGGVLIAPSVDFIWIHDFHRHVGTHCGVELGVGYDTHGSWFPLVAIFAGLRF